MLILGIETSCDETAAAIVEANDPYTPVSVLSSVLATSLALHAQTGGIIPEIAAREQVKIIVPVIKQALHEAQKKQSDIDAIAVTYGPGLIGSLLVGVETAKALAYAWDKPLIPVNHLFGHIYANWIGLRSTSQSQVDRSPMAGSDVNSNNKQTPEFPAIALIVSGGHTDLVLMKNHNDIVWLGGTRDDAAGEAFDKIGRELQLPYPAGPAFEKSAAQGNPKRFQFPRPLKYDAAYDFSFSGLKTAAIRVVQKVQSSAPNSLSLRERAKGEGENSKGTRQSKLASETISDITRCVQDAIIDVIVYKTIKAAEAYHAKSIVLGGGVAANQTLRETLQQAIVDKQLSTTLHVAEKRFCTDNAAMIASAAYFMGKEMPWSELTANPELYFD